MAATEKCIENAVCMSENENKPNRKSHYCPMGKQTETPDNVRNRSPTVQTEWNTCYNSGMNENRIEAYSWTAPTTTTPEELNSTLTTTTGKRNVFNQMFSMHNFAAKHNFFLSSLFFFRRVANSRTSHFFCRNPFSLVRSLLFLCSTHFSFCDFFRYDQNPLLALFSTGIHWVRWVFVNVCASGFLRSLSLLYR